MLFRERLTVPLAWWVLAALFALSVLLAFGFYLGPVWGVGSALVTMVVAAAVFAALSIEVSVDATALRVGRAVVERHYIGGCRALDAAAADRRGGVEADARAHLVLRPYITTAVEVVLDDPADPVPYWLVSTRRPARLAAALASVSATGPVG